MPQGLKPDACCLLKLSHTKELFGSKATAEAESHGRSTWSRGIEAIDPYFSTANIAELIVWRTPKKITRHPAL
jgi:hypothetical protein